MLIGVIGPPRSERMTGPEPKVSVIHEAKAVARSSCSGIVRPLFFFAAQSRSSIDRRYLATRVEHHVPGEFGDFAGAQASFHRQENDDAIAKRVSGLYWRRRGAGLIACH